MDWLKAVGIVTQKGANGAAVAIGVKLLVLDADLQTETGVQVALIGALLLGVGAIIEYLMWRDTTNILAALNRKNQEALIAHLSKKD